MKKFLFFIVTAVLLTTILIGCTPNAEIDKEKAISIAMEELKEMQKAGHLHGFEFHYISETSDAWIVVCYKKSDLSELPEGVVIVGGSYEFVVSKYTGKIIEHFPGE